MESKNNIFKTTFLISLAFHAIILFPLPEFKQSVADKDTPYKVSYLSLPIPQKIIKNITPSTKKTRKKSSITKKKKVASAKSKTKKTVKKIIRRKVAQRKKRQGTKIQNITKPTAVEKKTTPEITTSEKTLNNSLRDNKSYVNYYKIINQQLRESVIYPEYFSEGKVAVSFVVTADGNLRSIEIEGDNSDHDTALRETAVQIVKKASPFPPFPETLRRIQLMFNVVISFQEQG
ncbi:MAG: TonB family protein [PVC group bacterium]|nr:TonB family protein [PVC group bacterium]